MLLGKEEEKIKKNIALNMSFFFNHKHSKHSCATISFLNLGFTEKSCFVDPTCNWTVVLPEVR